MYCPNCGVKQPLQPVSRRVLEDGNITFPMVSFTLDCPNCHCKGDVDLEDNSEIYKGE